MELRIASYNIHRCVGTDRRCNVPRIVEVIRELECDTVGLQEVDNQNGPQPESLQAHYIAEALGMTAIPGLRMIRHTGEYGNVLLTRRPVLSVQRHDLSYSIYEPRGALDVKLDVDGLPVRVLLTHLGLAPMERRHQVRTILALITDSPPEEPVILLGDINEWFPRGRPLRWLHAHFGNPPAVASFPSFWPLLALDRIWVNPRAALQSVQAHRTPLSRTASDHLPIKAVVSLTP